jgi:HEAT repeat protein
MTDLEELLDGWKRKTISVDDTRSLAADIGNKQYFEGIPALMELLDDQDEIVRYNAAMSLGFEFQYKPAAAKLRLMLEKDSDEDSREMAAGALGSIFQDSKDPRYVSALGKAALDDPDEGVRISAYRALLRVSGPQWQGELLKPQAILVDRALVQSILASLVE